MLGTSQPKNQTEAHSTETMDSTSRQSMMTSLQDYPMYYGIGVTSIIIIGTALHILSIIVLSRKFMRSAASFYLMALSMFDMIHLFSTGLAYCASPVMALAGHNISELTNIDSVPARLFIKVFPLLEISQALISVYIFALTVEYYNYIFKETHARKVLNNNSSQNTVFLIFGVVVLMHLPTIFKMEIIHLDIAGTKIVKMCTSTLFLKNAIQVYEKVLMPILFGWIPVIGSITTAIVIFIRVRLQKERKEERTTPTSFHLRQGRSLPAVYMINVFHFILYVPILIVTSLNIARSELISPIVLCFHTLKDISLSEMEHHWELICVTLALVDSSSRFLFYYAFNRPFSYTLHRMCACNYFEVNKGPPTVANRRNPIIALTPNTRRSKLNTAIDKPHKGRDNRAFVSSEMNHKPPSSKSALAQPKIRNSINAKPRYDKPPKYSHKPQPMADQMEKKPRSKSQLPQGQKGQGQMPNRNHVNSSKKGDHIIIASDDSDVSESWI